MIGNIDDPAGQTMSPSKPPQPPEVTQPTILLKDLGLRKTSARSSITTVTKRDTMKPSIPSHQSQKTSTNLGNFRVGD